MKTELEFKWFAGTYDDFSRMVKTSRRFGASTEPEEQVRNRDYYVDTPGADIRAGGGAARIRNRGVSWEFTYKGKTEFSGGLARRDETTCPLEAGTASSALKELKTAALRAKGLDLPFERLEEVFTVDTRRVQRIIHLPGGTDALASFDDAKINVADMEAHLCEIEFEFLEGNEQGFKNFARKMAATAELKPATMSKVSAARAMQDGKIRFQ